MISSNLYNSFEAPLYLKLKPSPYLLSILAVFYTSLLVAMIQYPIEFYQLCLLSMLFMLSASRTYAKIPGVNHQIKGIYHDKKNGWRIGMQYSLESTQGESLSWHKVAVIEDYCLFSWLIVINLKDENGRTYHLPLFKDSFSTASKVAGVNSFHKLISRLGSI